MGTSVRIVADSISPVGKRITTFVLRYPRYIHSEFMTHRAFSRNASSSRAIPLSKMIKQIVQDPVVPVHFGKNQSGMSANTELSGCRRAVAKCLWLWARWPAICFAYAMKWVGLHKQIANRILEPWMYIEVILTATEFDNFYALRCDKEHAHPDIYLLAERMLNAHNLSMANRVSEGEWHLPFVDDGEVKLFGIDNAIKMSVARCCRVSYLNHDNTKPDPVKDMLLADQLLQNHHMSPFEHQAQAHLSRYAYKPIGNFNGWTQHRSTLDNQNIDDFPRLLKKRGLTF